MMILPNSMKRGAHKAPGSAGAPIYDDAFAIRVLTLPALSPEDRLEWIGLLRTSLIELRDELSNSPQPSEEFAEIARAGALQLIEIRLKSLDWLEEALAEQKAGVGQ